IEAARAQAKLSSKLPENRAARDRAAELYFSAAKPLLDAQKFDQAADLLHEASARIPQNAQLELALGVSQYGLRRFDDAADAFLQTIAIDPEIEQPYT